MRVQVLMPVCLTVVSKAQNRDELIGAEGEDFREARCP